MDNDGAGGDQKIKFGDEKWSDLDYYLDYQT